MATVSQAAVANWIDEVIGIGACWAWTALSTRFEFAQSPAGSSLDVGDVQAATNGMSYVFDRDAVMGEPRWVGLSAAPAGGFTAVAQSSIDSWKVFATDCTSSEARAHFSQLVLVAGPKAERRARAEQAAIAHLEIADRCLSAAVDPLDIEAGALRSFGVESAHVALVLGNQFRLARQADAAGKLLLSTMAGYVTSFDTGATGFLCALARALSTDPTHLDEARRLLEDAAVTNADDLVAVRGINEELLEMRSIPALTDSQRAVYQRRIVQTHLDEANGGDGLRAMLSLDLAAKRARNWGQTDLADQALRLMQAIDTASDVKSVVTTAVAMPPQLVQAFRHEVGKVAGAPSLAEALRVVATHPAPCGPPPAEAEVAAFTQGILVLPVATLNSLDLPTKITGVPNGILDDNVTVVKLKELYEIDLAALTAAQIQITRMLFTGQLVRMQLEVAARVFVTDPTAVSVAIAVPGVDDLVLERLARVLRLFWTGDDGDLDSAMHLATGICERLLRHLLVRHDNAIFAVQKGQENGHLRLMTALLDELNGKAWFDANWRRSLELLLCREGVGLNVRNATAHGELRQVTRDVGALMIQCCLLLLVEIRKTI